ncbi:MAG TPA: NAD(P)/FAD-dependent oxidoreductase [Solirubrobacteraceae bacterium]|nr:NAD(P)/FAD-dependent oxidoreductase [Solirubrobacteraceae bacterium]
MNTLCSPPKAAARELDAVIIGAGFSGLYMLHRLRGLGLRARVLERGSGVGGTWFWNRYPGARCDIESIDYAYSFSEELLEEWTWSERYATQPEILRYLNYVADRFDLRSDVQLNTRVVSAHYDEVANRWLLDTAEGERFRAQFCIMATGCLSSVNRPDFPGLDEFAGEWFHTARWPEEGVDFSGRRVGVIGTGSTAIQAIPQIAKQAEQLYVFQRTPNYSMPAQNRPMDPDAFRELLRDFTARRREAERSDAGVPVAPPEKATFEVSPDERRQMYEAGWQRGGINALSYAFTDYFTSEEANAVAQEFAREKIREIVRDPEVADLLCPRHHIGTKRTCVDIGYYETYNRDNVELVDLRRAPLVEITPQGIRTTEREYRLDSLVFATGFDAMTGALLEIDVRGRAGTELRRKWADGPVTYLGLAVAGMPNMFIITGPGSPSVLSNMVLSIEQHVDWVADAIAHLRERGLDRIEASDEAEAAWVAHVNQLANATLYPQAASWYVGANIPGKPRVFMPYVAGCGPYRRECEDVVRRGYAGFTLTASADGAETPDAGVARRALA